MLPDLEKLKTIQFLSGIDPAGLESIVQYVTIKNVEKGELFVREGEKSALVFFVVAGLIKVYITSPHGKEQVLNIASTGETLNDVSAYDDGTDIANMVAITPVTVYCMTKKDLKAIILNHPQLALNALRVIARRVRRAQTLLEELSFDQAIGRLAKILLRYSREIINDNLFLTQQEMASMIGTSREMVNKSLKKMEEKGAIRLKRHRIEIINIDMLNEIAVTAPETRS